MNTFHSSSKPERNLHEMIADRWPVLARLPQVAVEPSPRPQSSRAPTDADPHDYRFDPPQAYHASHLSAGNRTSRAAHHESSVLPKSNPFAIPTTNLLGNFGPTVRFLTLVALFAMAGMILLRGGNNEQPPTREAAPADAAVMHPSLEPAATAVETATPAASATGPASIPLSSTDPHRAEEPNAPDLAAEEDADDATLDDIQVMRETPEDANSPYPQPAWPPAAMPWTDQEALPQAQMTDPAPPLAHLPGYITELAPRQASNDDDQPSLH